MAQVVWDKRYEVGHPRIDHEHQVFVDLLRTVTEAAARAEPRERVGRLLLEVRKYAEFHFISEENIMIDAGFPEYESHRQEHGMLLANLDQQFQLFRQGALELEEIADFMFDWFAMHTTRLDLRLGDYLRQQQGIASA
jgi:hemerythrin